MYALDQHEITLQEFGEAMASLPSEVLQVIAVFLSRYAEQHPEHSAVLVAARRVCSRLATTRRSLN